VKRNYHLYLGKAGHLAVMSEFLIRGWNVAIPEVDIGDDIFVVQDDNGTLRRVQVKTSAATTRQNSQSGQFKKVECSGLDLTKYVSDFSDFPLIEG
jgi:hypothetical protein